MEDYKKLYEQTQSKMKEFIKRWDGIKLSSNDLFTEELKQIVEIESEDERIRKEIIEMVRNWASVHYITKEQFSERMTWLEKQGNITKLSEEEKNKFANGVLTSCALSFINYLDAHKYEGKMCVSNGECEDIENAFHNAMWDRLHRYYCKYIEKQGEPNPYIGVSFKYNGRTWDMCARDGGVAILVDGEIKERIVLDNKPQDKSALEAIKEEKVDNELAKSLCVEPKFKVGDWVVNKFGDSYHIDSLDKKNYQVSDGKGNYNYFPISKQDEMHLWAIQDAKDGDVLVCDINKAEIGGDVEKLPNIVSTIFNFKKLINIKDYIHSYCHLYDKRFLGLQRTMYYNSFVYNISPATKEQRDFLFQKIKESGYEWDADKKELFHNQNQNG